MERCTGFLGQFGTFENLRWATARIPKLASRSGRIEVDGWMRCLPAPGETYRDLVALLPKPQSSCEPSNP